jgi:uncharacterized protein YjiK
MTIARSLALLVILVPSAVACRDTPRARAEQARAVEVARKQELARRIAVADASPATPAPLAVWLVPPELREISGLTLTASGSLLAHDDEIGAVYQIDPKAGIVLKRFVLDGVPRQDFEAIATIGPDIYLLESHGHLFKFREGADGEVVPYTTFDTRLGHQCEFEGMAYEAGSSRLLLACKKVASKSLKDHLVIYQVPVPLTDVSRITMLAIPKADVIGAHGWKNFEPADMAIDPTTGNYVIVASIQKALAVITPGGTVVRSELLPGDHPQAEGLTITKDNIMIISDEATTKPAVITLYRWRP